MRQTQDKGCSCKEKVQYGTAITTLTSGIVMCFLSFFMNEYEIENSVLMYFGQTLIFCGGVFGVNLFIKSKIFEAETRLNHKIDKKMRKVDDLIIDEDEDNKQ